MPATDMSHPLEFQVALRHSKCYTNNIGHVACARRAEEAWNRGYSTLSLVGALGTHLSFLQILFLISHIQLALGLMAPSLG